MTVKKMLQKITGLWLILCPLFSVAQNFRLTQLTTHDGLPIDNVYAAAQDDNGFIWFGTDFGIARYDGNYFTNYYKNDGMANKAVTDIVYAGGDSLIFFSYPSTIQAIHKDGHINTLVTHTGFSLHQLIKHYQQYYCFERGNALFGILENGKYQNHKADSAFNTKETRINSILSLGDRGVAFCTSKGLFIKKGNQLTALLNNRNVQFIIYTKQKTLLAVVDGRLHQSDKSFVFKELAYHFPPGFTVYHAAEDKNDVFWFRGLDKGIYRLDKNGLQEMSERIGMENKTVHEFFPDADGNFWFCTDGSGVLLKKNSDFINYETRDGLANNRILRLLKNQNELLIGTSNGISVLKDKNISVIDLPRINKGLQYVYQLFAINKIVTGICIDKTVSFIDNVSKNKSRVKDFKTGQYDFRAFDSQFAWQQDANNYWLVGSWALTHIQTGIEKKEIFDLHALKVRKGYCMTAYENKLWLGTDAGIVFIDKDSISKKDSIEKIKLGQVLAFLTDKKNRLWIATDIGLYVYDGKQFTVIQTGNTTGSKYCTGLTEDDRGGIWVSTWDGCFVFNGDKKVYYNTNNGLPSKTANCILFDTIARQLFIGTDNGLAVLEKTISLNTGNSRKIFINCNIAGYGERNVMDNSTLSPDESNLKFYLSFPYYQGMNEVNYEYRLDDGPWISTINPSINLSDIGRNQHHFYARAKINDTIISNGETVFTFTINKPFYQKWWFWIPALLLFQILVFRVINHFNKKAKEKKLTLQMQKADYASLKQQAFTSLMNPHFIFNALNSVQHYINKQDRQLANKYLSNFATLIRRSFEAAQKSFVTLEEELETMRLYLELEQMRFTDKFEYRINISPAAADEDWMLPSMMLQPFLENAVLHGLMPLDSKGLLTIDVTAENNSLKIVITDNGIGIEKSKALRSGNKHNSKGMQLINERLEILSKLGKEPITLTITALNPGAPNPGTKITLIIPQEVYEVFQQQRNPA
jgi:ligand-binding sensor domain-containing protein